MVLSDADRALIAAVQDGLPLVAHPYAEVAALLGTTEHEVLERMARLQQQGMIKRLGVVVRHRALGYTANAMVVWDVPDDRVEDIGALLAAEPCVTLCYQRPRRLPRWPYNLFCMIHGRTREGVRHCLEGMITTHRLQRIPHDVLFSTRAFKQCGARYAATGSQPAPREAAHG
jgi:DNA-binding Lrp family transcriptional regulator